jgi:hypothetical protein
VIGGLAESVGGREPGLQRVDLGIELAEGVAESARVAHSLRLAGMQRDLSGAVCQLKPAGEAFGCGTLGAEEVLEGAGGHGKGDGETWRWGDLERRNQKQSPEA